MLWCLLLVNFNLVLGNNIDWYQGSIVVTTGQVVSGELSVNTHYGLVLHKKEDNTVDVYPAFKVNNVHFYDHNRNVNRKIVSLKLPQEKNPVLMEVVVNGKIDILRRCASTKSDVNASDLTDYDYYVVSESALVPLSQFCTKVYPSMRDSMVSFLKENNLDVFDVRDIIRVVVEYNKREKELTVAVN
jgi:hypothetical protein